MKLKHLAFCAAIFVVGITMGCATSYNNQPSIKIAELSSIQELEVISQDRKHEPTIVIYRDNKTGYEYIVTYQHGPYVYGSTAITLRKGVIPNKQTQHEQEKAIASKEKER